jgi:hypothetical protein
MTCMKFVNIKEGLSEKQIERQKKRENGRYTEYHTCELCGKKIEPTKYWSDERCNVTGDGLILCKPCCLKSDEMKNKEFLETFCKRTSSPESIERYRMELKKAFPERE